jgi:hypothetical protein
MYIIINFPGLVELISYRSNVHFGKSDANEL